jgi:hypothetical protein
MSREAEALAERFRYQRGESLDLARVAEYAAATRGYGPLYDELHALTEPSNEPSPTHRFFPALAPNLRERGAPNQLLVTTAYDTALERAFVEAGEEVDVVSYLASGPDRGKFCHVAPDGTAQVIDLPNVHAEEDGRTIAAAGSDLAARLWSTDGRLLHTLRGHTAPLTGAAFDRTGSRVVTTSADRDGRI